VGDLLELQDTTNYTVPPLVYLWTRPDGTRDTTTTGQLFINGASSGDYMLTVTSGGCASVPDTQNVQYEAIPVALDDNFTVKFRDSLIGADIVINDVTNPNGYVTGLIGTTPNSTVLFNTDGTINYTPNGGFFGEDTVLYSLCDAQCPTSCDTATIVVDVTTDFECFIPNGFSPNGDGVNDEVIIRCRNNYPNAEIEIFSRWGTLVYKGIPTGWNGQFEGADLPDGTYFYVLKLNDKTYVGNTTDKSQGRVGDQYTGFIILQR
jgi:gliding motility-associated-like protein